MTKKEIESVRPGTGLFRAHWTTGGSSLAAMGVTLEGGRWLAPTNWVYPAERGSRWWRLVERMEWIEVPEADQKA